MQQVHILSERRSGFTLVEVVVMLGVITFLSAIVIGGFGRTNQGTVVKRAAEQLALAVRQAQSYALSGKVAPIAGVTPRYWGLSVNISDPIHYSIVADVNGDYVIDETISSAAFEDGASISGISSATNSAPGTLNFLFSVPYGELEVKSGTIDQGSWGKVTLSSAKDNFIKNVIVQVSGHVLISN